MERFNLRNLNDVEAKEEYQDKMSNRFAPLERSDDDDDDDDDGGGGGGDDDVDISGAWEDITENTKASATESIRHCELKQHETWFDEEFSM